jgi:AcrR family transcriptional regulator
MDVRAEILTTATRLFARQGFHRTTLQAIADEVGIRKPSLLYHYPSKDHLRLSVLEKLIEHWNDVLPRLLGAVSRGDERFEVLVRELVGFFREDPDRARLVVRELMDRPTEMREHLAAGVRPWVDLLSEYIRKGKQSGELHADVDPEAYVVHVITLVVSGMAAAPVLSGLLQDDDSARERHVRELVRIARASLFTHAPR